MQTMMPRTGDQIQNMKFTHDRAALLEWIDAHKDKLGTVLFVCQSGMLAEMEKYLFREHWLPSSNKYVHNVARAFFGHVLCKMAPGLTIDDLQTYTSEDPDIVWKLLFKATNLTRKSKVPTLHKLSFMKLLCDRHDQLGKPLCRIQWDTIKRNGLQDFDQYGVFSVKRDASGDIVAVQHQSGAEYKFSHPIAGRMETKDCFSLMDARLEDPMDEEDPIILIRRFKSVNKDWSFVPSETKAVEESCSADSVRIKGEATKEEEGGSSSTPSMAQLVEPPPLKKAKTEAEMKEELAATAPCITPLKATRKPRGGVKRSVT